MLAPWTFLANLASEALLVLAAQQEQQRKQQEAFAKAQELRQILNSLEKVDDEGRRSSLLDTLCATDDVLALTTHPNPPGIQTGDLKVNLLNLPSLSEMLPKTATPDFSVSKSLVVSRAWFIKLTKIHYMMALSITVESLRC